MIQRRAASIQRSQGAILLVSLLLLLAMTIIGVAAIDTSTLQSQMSRNSLEANTRYQITINEIEGHIKWTADRYAYRTSIIKGTPISATPAGVSKAGNGLVLTDADMITQDTTDQYQQAGFVVFPGFDTGAHHGFSIGKTKQVPIEFNIITTLTGTQSYTDQTQAAIFPAPPDNT